MLDNTDMGRGGKREGAGRKSIYGAPGVPVSFRAPTKLLKRIDAQAKKAGLSRAQMIVKLLTAARKG